MPSNCEQQLIELQRQLQEQDELNESTYRIDENRENQKSGYKDVIIIGNGPSGLSLSYILSGHWPYWNRTPVSDEYLQMRLEYSDQSGKSLIEQDLEYLSDGLVGRSNNSVALLYDILKHPDADLEINRPSCLSWMYNPLNEIDHLVIGKSSGPGGAWNDLDGSQLTISPSRWMELPELTFSDWERQEKMSGSTLNAGLVFSAKNTNFSEDNSLLNAHSARRSLVNDPINLQNYLKKQNLSASENDSLSQARVSMHDVRNYYRDYVKQKNLDKYLLNNACVTSVRRVCPNSKLQMNSTGGQGSVGNGVGGLVTTCSNPSESSSFLWEVTGIIDKRDRKKASSLTHKGDLMEFRYLCKHLVLANGAADIHNKLHVKGESSRIVLRSLRQLEDKIRDDLPRLQKRPLVIVGAGLSAADAILLAQKHGIRIIHVIRRSVHDKKLVFAQLPHKSYPEYHQVYNQMLSNRYCDNTSHSTSSTSSTESYSSSSSSTSSSSSSSSSSTFSFSSTKSSSTLNSQSDDTCEPNKSYVLYDEHQVKCFTTKRTCIITSVNECKINQNDESNSIECELPLTSIQNDQSLSAHNSSMACSTRFFHHRLNVQHQHCQQLNECDEENNENMIGSACQQALAASAACKQKSSLTTDKSWKCNDNEIEIEISYACVLVGFSADLEFLPVTMTNKLGQHVNQPLNTKDNPIDVNEFTHESRHFSRLYAMGPLVGDNFVRFGTGGSLAISSSIVKQKKQETAELLLKQKKQQFESEQQCSLSKLGLAENLDINTILN